MLSVFFCVCILLAFLIPDSQGQCRELRFTSAPIHGYWLKNHVIRTIRVSNEDICEWQCYLEPKCVSYNFRKEKEANGEHKCDLNNATYGHDNEHAGDLLKNRYFVYRGAENACAKKPCENKATCQAGFTDRRYQCLCIPGFTGLDCENDINECTTKAHSCDDNAECVNTEGSYECTCKDGFHGDGKQCIDIDECANETHRCDVNAVCNNTQGSHNCTCKDGFHGDDVNCIECDAALGIESRNITDGQISASSEYGDNYAAIQGRLNFKKSVSKEGAWSAGKNDVNQWLQIDLIGQYIVTRVATQGRDSSTYQQWVTSYKLQYGDDKDNLQYYRQQGQATDKEFAGNTDQDTVAYHYLNPPITVRYIRFRPVTWHDHISMRVELYGCKQECQGPLGMASGAITDAQISASSQRSANYAARQGRLHSKAIWIAGAWSAGKNDVNQWLQIDLNGQYKITRVATQGRNAANYDWWVTKYKLQYSNNTTRFQDYKEPDQEEDKEFAGNTDRDTVVYHDLNQTITARYIRFRPVAWEKRIAMRVELFGCMQGQGKDGQCQDALGMESGNIIDAQIRASSQRSASFAAIHGRLQFKVRQEAGAWSAGKNDDNQWLQTDLIGQYIVTRVATQGRDRHDHWVTKYKLQYGDNEKNFQFYKEPGKYEDKEFAGNTDQETVVYHYLNPPISARYIRFLPVAWHTWISMRVELYGCGEAPEPVAFYPLNECYKAAEKDNKKPAGILSNVALTFGPYNEPKGAYEFFGNDSSYIKFPNNGGLDARHSITLMCWVQPGGQGGPLFSYGRSAPYGVHIWINNKGTFSSGITKFPDHTFLNKITTDESLTVREWAHVTATYNNHTGDNSLYINGVLAKWQNIGKGHKISTHHGEAFMGAIEDKYLKGKVSQMKIYDVALNEIQIKSVMNEGCQEALGMESFAITDGQITASSEHNAVHSAIYGRLRSQGTTNQAAGAWVAKEGDNNPWLQVDLGDQYNKVTRVATQGRDSSTYQQWVTRYKLQYGDDGNNFQYYRQQGQATDKEFVGNTDQDTVVYHDLNPPITARYIRFVPVTYENRISMRVELYGCTQGWHSGHPSHSCKHIRDSGGSRGDGEYWIDPEKSGTPLKVFCDMTTDAGGWLLVSNVVIDSSSSRPQFSVETSYRGISSYHSNKMFLKKSAMTELRTHLSFTQLRFHCSKQQGRTFHVTTVANSTGEAVVQYFSGETNVLPDACGSFVRMENDNSRLAGVCDKWGKENGAYSVSKWGNQDRDEERLYDHAAFVGYLYHWLLTPDGSRWECDDFSFRGYHHEVSSGDFWKVFVR